MLLNIVKWPSPKLKMPSMAINGLNPYISYEGVKGVEVDIKKLVADMTETMKAAGGVGLSAIQVGVPVQVITTVFPGFEVLINPVVQTKKVLEAMQVDDFGDEMTLTKTVALGTLKEVREGCLSLPGFSEDVKRYDKANVMFETLEDFTERSERSEIIVSPLMYYKLRNRQPTLVKGLLAQCLQHEAEHLRGDFFLDHVKPARRDAIRVALRRAR